MNLARLLLPLLLFPAAAMAQGGRLSDHDVADSGKCPTLDEVEQELGPSSYSIGQGWTFVVAPSVRAYRSSLPAADNAPIVPPLFEKVTIFADSEDRSRLLISWGSPMLCTWVPASDLLIPDGTDPLRDLISGPRPLRVGDIDPDDPGNQLTVKAVLSNLNVAGDQGVVAFEDEQGTTEGARLRLFEFYSVFARGHGQPRGAAHADIYYLLGKAGFREDQLIGWVSEEDVYLWNSRMAASWSGSGKGRGWAHEYMEGEPVVLERVPLPEPSDRSGERFPVLDMRPISSHVQDAAGKMTSRERTPLALADLVDAYRLVVRGLACSEGAEDCLSPEAFAKLRQDYELRLAALRRIDVLFLMDATESMGPYFPTTAEATRDFAREQLGTPEKPTELDLRVGVSIYGDYGGTRADVNEAAFANIVPLHDPRLSDSKLNVLNDFAANFAENAPRDPHADKLEAPFAALIRAARETGWREDAGYRIIVHVGDHGNRDVGAKLGEGASSAESIGVADVAAVLAGEKVLYLPISVIGKREEPGPAGDLARQARAAFIQQAGAILRARDLKDEVVRSYKDASGEETESERRNAVLRALRAAAEGYFLAKDIVEARERCARTPDRPECADLAEPNMQGSDISTAIAHRIIVENQLTSEQTENIFSRAETALYGWAPPVEGDEGAKVETLKYWVALDPDRLRGLTETFGVLCSIVHPDSGDISRRIQEAFATLAGVASGEEISLSQSVAVAMSLPFWERMDVMSIELNRIARIVRDGDPKVVLDWRRQFCRTNRLLGYVAGGQQLSDTSALPTDQEGLVLDPPRGSLQTYDWLAKSERGEGFYYVPVEYFP